jgi:hypothetical protein
MALAVLLSHTMDMGGGLTESLGVEKCNSETAEQVAIRPRLSTTLIKAAILCLEEAVIEGGPIALPLGSCQLRKRYSHRSIRAVCRLPAGRRRNGWERGSFSWGYWRFVCVILSITTLSDGQ